MQLLKRTLLIAIISTLSVSALCQSTNQAGINFGYGIWDGVHAGGSYRFDRYSAGLGREISLGRSFSLGYQGGPILPVYSKRKRKTNIEDKWAAVPIFVNLRFRITYKSGRELSL
ncbi:MAG: hypothetical protein R6U58_10255 [Bacteroidales bacterium]